MPELGQKHDSWMEHASWGLQHQSSVQLQHGLLLVVMHGKVSDELRAALAVSGVGAEWAVTTHAPWRLSDDFLIIPGNLWMPIGTG